MRNYLTILPTLFYLIYAQYDTQDLVNTWVFTSMTTITKAEREKITIVYNDENNLETLTFEESGAIHYYVVNDGIVKKGAGVWYAEGQYLTIIVDSDTTYGNFSLEENILSIIISEDESDEFYGSSNILKYTIK